MRVSVGKPLTRLWICVVCGEVWEMLFGVEPDRSTTARPLCPEHASQIVSEIVL